MGLFDFVFGKKPPRRSTRSINVQLPESEHNPPTERQLQYARDLEIEVQPTDSYEDVSQKIRQAKLDQPPYPNQVELCKRVGLPISPTMSRRQVEALIEQARSDPRYAPRFAEIEAADSREAEQEEREFYGDALIDERNRWESVSSNHHLLVFRRSQNIAVDIVEFDTTEIVDGKKPYVSLGVLLPKKVKERDLGEYLDWSKELTLKAKNVLHVQDLRGNVDEFDVQQYERLIDQGREFAKRFETV